MNRKLGLSLFLSVNICFIYAMEEKTILYTAIYRAYGFWMPLEDLAEKATEIAKNRERALPDDPQEIEKEERTSHQPVSIN